MENFSFDPPINLVEEGKWLLAVTFFEATNSVFNITDETIAFQLVFQLAHQVTGFLKVVKNLLTN